MPEDSMAPLLAVSSGLLATARRGRTPREEHSNLYLARILSRRTARSGSSFGFKVSECGASEGSSPGAGVGLSVGKVEISPSRVWM